MAKKKRKHPQQQRNSAGASGPPPRGGANQARRDRKEEARGLREAERKRVARRNTMRRLLTFAAFGLIGVLVITFLGRVAAPTPLPEEAEAAASEAGCRELERPSSDAPGGLHLTDEQALTFVYPDPPATSGQHASTTLPATTRVYDSPQAETQAVHTLEHGSVIVYYRPSGEEGGVSQEVVTRLGTLVTEAKASYLMPYPDLPTDIGIAFTAWNERMLCPGAMTPDQAATVAQGFVDAYACTSNAPEGNNGDGC